MWGLMRRVVIAVVGGAIVTAGIALFFLPGPGALVLLLGLSILATEFGWARRARQWVYRETRSLARLLKAKQQPQPRAAQQLSPSDRGLRKAASLSQHPLAGSADEVTE